MPFPRSWAAGVLLAAPALFAADIDKPKDAAPAAAGGFRPLVKEDRREEPLLAPASREGEARIRQFKTLPGVRVDLWAAEPMLANPVAFTVDEHGRVFTSETYRYRTSVLDIRHYMFFLEDDLAARTITNRLELIRKWFGPQGEKELSRETEVVRLVEDTDHDGVADKSTVFADRLNSPLDGIASGVLARKGQVWLTDMPSLWRFSPGADPGKPRKATPLASSPRVAAGYHAEELLRGFGVRFNFTGHDLHGLRLGPDGRLYFSCGDRGAHVATRGGGVVAVPDEGAVFRCEPDGSGLEVVHRGLRNPQELAFDATGDWFTGDNDSDQGDRERWVQVIDGADSGWRVGYQHAPLGNAGPWNLERLWVPSFEGQAAYLLPPVANIGDGPSGLVADPGTGLDARLRGRFFLAYFKGTSAKSGVSSIALRPDGAGYRMTAHDEFLWNALVPDVDIGPDGALWFADWHEGWPKSNKGRIYRATFPGAGETGAEETRKLLDAGFAARGEDELLGLLGHADQRVRLEAQHELASRLQATRGDASASLERRLGRIAQSGTGPMARIHAAWCLGEAGRRSQWRPALLPLLRAEHGEVAVQAARAIAWWAGGKRATDARRASPGGSVPWDRFLHESLTALLADGNARQRAAAAEALGLAGWKGFDGALRAAVTRHPVDADPAWRTVAATALSRHPAGRNLGAWVGSTNRSVRLTALLAMRRTGSDAVKAFLDDPDPLLVLEAARAINDAPVDGAMGALAALGEPARLATLLRQFAPLASGGAGRFEVPEGTIRDVRASQPLPWGDAPLDSLAPMLLRVVNANLRAGGPEAASRLASMSVSTNLPAAIRAEAVSALAAWPSPAARDRVVGVYRPLPARDGGAARDAASGVLPALLSGDAARAAGPLVPAAIAASSRLAPTNAGPLLAALLRDTNNPASSRAAALQGLADLRATETQDALKLAMADPADALRLAASRINALLNPGDAAGQLAAKLSSGTLAEQQGAFASLGDLKSEAADALLAEWLDKLTNRAVAPEVALDLVEAAGKRSAPAVKARLAAYQEWKLPKDDLSPYREALAGGDAARGKKIFYENASVACTRCHQIGSDGGGNAGPPLAGIASRQPREYLLESVVFPNKQVAAGFETAMITLANGQTLAGVVKSETDAEIALLSPEDGEVKVRKADVKSREKGLSGMPEGFGQLLTRQELRDVVEFLGTLK